MCLAVTFGSPTTFGLSGGTFTGTDLGIGDFNRDGKMDVVLGYTGTPSTPGDARGGPAVFLNVGGGLLGAGTRTPGVPQPLVSVGDFDGDAVLDLAYPYAALGQVGMVFGKGDGAGGFNPLGGQFVPGTGVDLLSGDFTGDGRADLVVSDGNDRLQFLAGNAASGLGSPTTVPFPAFTGPRLLASADFNGDTKLDLLVADAVPYLTVLVGTGTGGFGSKPPSPGGAPRDTVTALATGDFNGDGKADAVSAVQGAGVILYPGAGDGTFTGLAGISSDANVSGIAVGDFDGDGRQDLAVAIPASGGVGGVRVYRGLGNGTFEAPVVLPLAGGAGAVAAADFNADGRLDLAVAQAGPAGVTVYLNTSPPVDATPPTARLEAMNITVAGKYLGSVDVVYTDNVAVNPATVASGDLTITGPGGFSQASSLYSTVTTSGSQVRVRYYFSAPASGYWNSTANGTYTVSLNANRVKDASGNAAAGGTLGSFQVNVPVDTTPPQTVLASAPDVTIGGGTQYRLGVVHSDNVALPAVIGEGAVVVRSPSGATLGQGFIYRIYPPPGTPMPYDYAVVPPGGSWDASDNGTYTIALLPDSLFDTSGNPAAAKTLGTFRVNIQPGTASITAAVFDDANADGVQGAGEGPLSFQQVYLDLNGNGVIDGGEPAKFTSGAGTATFADLPAGDYVLRAVPSASVLAGQFQTTPAAEHRVTLAAGATASRSFGMSGLPGVVDTRFEYQTAPHALKIFFNRNVSTSLGLEDVSVINLTTGQPVFPTSYRYDPIENNKTLNETATFTFAGVLPDGNYRVTLNKAGIVDNQGRPLAGKNVFDFFVLGGDATHDRVVNFDDLLALAKNYNKTGAAWAEGDFNGDGVVNFNDLLILAKAYNKSLPPPAPAAPSPALLPSFSAARPDVLASDKVAAETPFSTTSIKRPAPPSKVKPAVRPAKR